MLPIASRRAALLARPLRYLQLARFEAAIASDLGVALTEVDASGIIAPAGGQAVISGTPAATSNLHSETAFARKVGTGFFWRVPARTTIVSGNVRLGFGSDALDNALDAGIDYASTTDIRIKTGTTVIDTVALGAGVHEFALIQRGAGAFLFARTGGTGPYTLLWVYNTVTAAQFAKLHLVAGSALSLALDDWRVLDLAAIDSRFGSEYGLSGVTDPGPRAGGAWAYGHTPDTLIDLTITFDATTHSLGYRCQDFTTDKWSMRVQGNGTMNLRETVAGTTTNRVTAATPTPGNTPLQNGVVYRLKGVIAGNAHLWYVDNVLKMTYTDPSNLFLGAMGVTMPTTTAYNRIAFWPRTITLPGGV